jgi:hypothetical protein
VSIQFRLFLPSLSAVEATLFTYETIIFVPLIKLNVNSKEKKLWLFGIFCACPLKTPLKSCPFDPIRKLPLTERWKILNNLSDDEVSSLIKTHSTCLYNRELARSRANVPAKTHLSAFLF